MTRSVHQNRFRGSLTSHGYMLRYVPALPPIFCFPTENVHFMPYVCHAAPQFEIVCLKSMNAEDQERLFGQAESITGNTSNRHPNHVIPNLLLRIQAQANKQTRNSIQEQQSKISKMASQLPPGENTYITKAFIWKRQHSWQAHLIRIAPDL